jgi:hypothetical protein
MENNIIQDFLDEVGTSTIRRTKQTKRKQLAGRTAVRMAQKNKDPLYIRYKKYRAILMDLKKKLMAKYGRKGLSQARKTLR